MIFEHCINCNSETIERIWTMVDVAISVETSIVWQLCYFKEKPTNMQLKAMNELIHWCEGKKQVLRDARVADVVWLICYLPNKESHLFVWLIAVSCARIINTMCKDIPFLFLKKLTLLLQKVPLHINI